MGGGDGSIAGGTSSAPVGVTAARAMAVALVEGCSDSSSYLIGFKRRERERGGCKGRGEERGRGREIGVRKG